MADQIRLERKGEKEHDAKRRKEAVDPVGRVVRPLSGFTGRRADRVDASAFEGEFAVCRVADRDADDEG
jgi:hypothetical protein